MSARLRALAPLLALLAVGCTAPARDGAPIEAASIDGRIVIGDAFLLLDARLSVAPANAAAEGTRGRAVPLEDPPWTARTAMVRDHWVLEARLVERAPGSGAGLHRVRLDWNGAPGGEVYVEGRSAPTPLGVLARFDVGASIERSNVYAFDIARTP